jgi:hypothetical protein
MTVPALESTQPGNFLRLRFWVTDTGLEAAEKALDTVNTVRIHTVE